MSLNRIERTEKKKYITYSSYNNLLLFTLDYIGYSIYYNMQIKFMFC
jgi:hypothetical protein